jgi:hypothetical protein
MKTAISMPDDVFLRLEAAAQQAGLSRSEFYRNAGLEYASKLAASDITAALNAYIEATGDDGADPALTAYSRRQMAAWTAEDEW